MQAREPAIVCTWPTLQCVGLLLFALAAWTSCDRYIRGDFIGPIEDIQTASLYVSRWVEKDE